MAAAPLFAVLLVLQQATAPAGAAQAPAAVVASPDESAQAEAAKLPVSLERIQRALSVPAPIQLKEEHPVFRLEIYGRKPTIEDILGERFWVGPAPYGGMTHQDFLDKVTPTLAQPYAGFTGKYLLAETALTLMEQWALKSAVRHFRDASSEHERAAARKEVLDALAALERARRAAGLQDK